jgi:lipoate---protein ligase
MKVYFLDLVSWQESQALYHAAAYLGREALFILRPSTPYVCIGMHQDAEQEIDMAFAEAQGIPVFRREVGGGAVYLDGEQLFYQLILDSKRPEITSDKLAFYRKYLDPVVQVYKQFGIEAMFKPVNDIIVQNRKISGNGAAEIGDMTVLVGNFIIDFNYKMMSKVLRVPDEKFRDKVYKTLSDNLTTMLRETGRKPETKALADALVKAYQPLLGEMTSATLDDALIEKADELFKEMNTPDWLYGNDRRRPDTRQVKIREEVYVIQKMMKFPGGLVRINAIAEAGKLREVHISGDFFIYPAEAIEELEETLEGSSVNLENLKSIIQDFYMQRDIHSPGILPEQFAEMLTAQA